MPKLFPVELISNCPICGSDNISIFLAPSISKCTKCEIIFRSRRPLQKDIKLSYDSDNTYSSWEPTHSERRFMWKRRIHLVKRYSKGTHLLDIGSGDGHFLEVATEDGYVCEGTEFSNAGMARTEKRGFDLHFGQLLDLQLRSSFYDVVTIWHVLEHVPNPGDVLREAYRILKPGGIIVVAVPNEENCLFRWRLRKSSINPLGDQNNIWGQEIHLTHFQPQTLRRALGICGFQIQYFGVDDIYKHRSRRNLFVLSLQKVLSFFIRWHFSMAMVAVAKKAD